ncbi:EF-hand domain-containing protein [Aquisediminimonas sediminicola]|uniref:EF-hand domain-containing protein n=1 Tax=Alteraquisediminimonas sediminicola TaxID=2676787 RepID=UPI001C8E0343|nr:EF-hand domain-containing protein [Aquisediminimonas sediminicola]
MKKLMIGVAAAALLAIPVLAAEAGHDGHMGGPGMADMMGAKGPATRADLLLRLKSHFTAADSNKDGFLVQSELDAAKANMMAEHQAMNKARMDAHFAELDTNKDGNISRAEFDAHHQGMKGQMGAHGDGPKGPMDMKSDGHKMDGKMGGHGPMGGMMSLEKLDANKDGKISFDEASAHPLAMFDAADSNKDGTISPEERRAARAAMWDKMRAMKGDADVAPAAHQGH